MTNTFITPQKVARYAVATLWDNLVMLPLVSRDFENEFVPGVGATVNYRKPAVLSAGTFTQAVGTVRQNITETYDSIVLNTHKYVSVAVTSADLTMNIEDFQRQVIQPAMEPLAQAVDTSLLALRSDITNSVTLTAYNASTNPNPSHDLISARRVLTSAKVPQSGRVAVVDEYIGSSLLKDTQLTSQAQRGQQATAAMEEGQIGRAYGFDTFETSHIDDFTGVAFHPSAFQFVTRPLALPKGAAQAEIINYKGLAVRVVYSYDASYKQDVIDFDILYGVKTVDATRACLLNGLADSV